MKRILSLILIALMVSCYRVNIAEGANQWRAGTGENTILGTEGVSDIDAKSYQNIIDPADRMLGKYRRGCEIVYASTITARGGDSIN